MTEFKRISLPAFRIAGLSVKTKNDDEFNPQTARLPELWQRFYQEEIPAKILHGQDETLIYGVYSHYESDASGAYTTTAGVKVSADFTSTDFNCITIESGEYLVFDAKGAMPEAIINAWKKVWQYFSMKSEWQRSYLTDFEAYLGPETAEIYIGIKPFAAIN